VQVRIAAAVRPARCLCGPAGRGVWGGWHARGQHRGWGRGTAAAVSGAGGLSPPRRVLREGGSRVGGGAALGVFLGLGSSGCRVSCPVSWLFFFASESIFRARLLLCLRSLLRSSRPWRPLCSLTEHGCSWGPGTLLLCLPALAALGRVLGRAPASHSEPAGYLQGHQKG